MGDGSFKNPDESFYDAEEKLFYPAVGHPMVMLPGLAKGLRKKKAKEISSGQLKKLRKAAKEKFEKKSAEVRAESAKKRGDLSGETVGQLDKLKGKGLEEIGEEMGEDDFEKFISWLKDANFMGEISGRELSDEFEINSYFVRKNFGRKLEALADGKKSELEDALDLLDNYFSFEKEKALKLIPVVITGWLVRKLQEELSVKYEYIHEFNKFTQGDCKITYDLTVKEGEGLDMTVGLTGYENEYRKFAKDEKARQDAEAVKRVAEGRAEAEEATKETKVQSRLDAIKEHPVGKFLSYFLPPESIRKIAEGKSPLLAFFLGMLGVGGFKKGYAFIKNLAGGHPKTASLVKTLDGMEKRAAKVVEGLDKADVAAKEEVYKGKTAAEFGEIIGKGGKIPEKGMELTEPYELGEGGRPKYIKVDLSKGGEIIIPAGTEGLKVNGKSVGKLAKKKVLLARDGKILLEGTIPAGTVFVGENIVLDVPSE